MILIVFSCVNNNKTNVQVIEKEKETVDRGKARWGGGVKLG